MTVIETCFAGCHHCDPTRSSSMDASRGRVACALFVHWLRWGRAELSQYNLFACWHRYCWMDAMDQVMMTN